MIFLRFLAETIIFFFMDSAHTSPTEGKEMGQSEGDKLNQNQYNNPFLLFLLRELARVSMFMLSIFHFTYFMNIPMFFYDFLFLFLAFLSWICRMWCYYRLGRLFTFKIGIRKDHLIIDDGLYRLVRHPSYTSQILVFLFSFLYLRINWIIWLMFIAMTYWKTNGRIKMEEEMLERTFGDDYRNYMSKTKYRLVPFLY